MSSILTGALSMGRRAAESRMTETVEVFERIESDDDDSLNPTFTETVEWTGSARLSISGGSTTTKEQAGQIVLVTRRELHLPVSAPGFVPGRYARVTASTVDPSLVGRVVRITSRPAAGQTTAHRYEVEEAVLK